MELENDQLALFAKELRIVNGNNFRTRLWVKDKRVTAAGSPVKPGSSALGLREGDRRNLPERRTSGVSHRKT